MKLGIVCLNVADILWLMRCVNLTDVRNKVYQFISQLKRSVDNNNDDDKCYLPGWPFGKKAAIKALIQPLTLTVIKMLVIYIISKYEF